MAKVIIDESNKFSAIILVDNTCSMGSACTAAKTSFPEIRAQLNLLNGSNCVEVAVIGDYDYDTPNYKQGGWSILSKNASAADVNKFMEEYVKPSGGGGNPEAYKTAFNFIVKMNELPSVVFMFCDSYPHGYGSYGYLDGEGRLEKKYIEENNMTWDWGLLCGTVKSLGIRVVTFLTKNDGRLIEIWSMMGDVICMTSNESSPIVKAMMWCFNVLTGQSIEQPGNKKEFETKTQINPIVHIDLSKSLNTADPEAVLTAFETLLDIKRPERAMCLTTNDILGKYWRLICGKIKYMNNQMYEPRCKKIMDILSRSMEKLNITDRAKLKEWIDRSHNDTPKIRDIVQKCLLNCPSHCLVLPANLASKISLNDVLQLGRSGDSYEVSKLISSLELKIFDENSFKLSDDESKPPTFVPMNSDNKTVFSLIANLLSPGLMFSNSESFMVAVLALKNKYLADIALSYLTNNKGKWIKWDLDNEGKQLYPTFWSLNFIRLLKLAPDEVLTDKEIKFRDHYLQISKIIRNHDVVIQITTPLIFKGLRPYSTWKLTCPGCSQSRCFTIFPGNSEVCGFCISFKTTKVQFYQTPADIKENDDIKSNWAQCNSCTGNYTVLCTDRLNVRPKCHNCRNNLIPELIECCKCLNKYVSPSESAPKAMRDALSQLSVLKGDNDRISERLKAKTIEDVIGQGKFVCPRCIDDPNGMISQTDVKISDLIFENKSLINLIPIKPYEKLMENSVSLWKRVNALNTIDNINDVADPKSFKFLVRNGFSIHNPSQVAEKIKDNLLDHNGIETCQLCVSEVPIRNMGPVCGNCPNRVCESCVKGWYSQVKIGHLVSPGHCACPFCKLPPIFEAVHGLIIQHIRNLRPTKKNKNITCEWGSRYIYGVCPDCLKIKIALNNECAAHAELPDIQNFVCEECDSIRKTRKRTYFDSAKPEDDLNIKSCPNPSCKTRIERKGGCYHITCPCGTHWCWYCNGASFEDGTPFNETTIYDHMSKCGGIFPDDLLE